MRVHRPRDLQAALATLSGEPTAVMVAGGTDVMVEMNYRRRRPEQVISLDAVDELRGWSFNDDVVRLGARLTYAEIENSAVGTGLPGLRQAARTVGSPPIRAAGTLGGNLGTASPAGDALPILLALDADVVVASATCSRVQPLRDFLVGPKRNALGAGELIIEVRVPYASGRQEFLKIGTRNAMVISVASVALIVDRERRQVRIALGSVGPTCLRATEAEGWVSAEIDWRRDAVSDGVANEFGRRVAAESSPIDDHRSTAQYRQHAVNVCARRALERGMA